MVSEVSLVEEEAERTGTQSASAVNLSQHMPTDSYTSPCEVKLMLALYLWQGVSCFSTKHDQISVHCHFQLVKLW